jgi:predicted HTH domain antitoxin
MKTTIHLDFPEELAFSLKMQDEEFAYEIKKMALVKLFELGKISSGKAAKALGITRIAFWDILHLYKVSIFNDADIDTIISDRDNA